MTRITVAILVAVCALAGHAAAQSFPERPITLINPYAAGGPADLLARTVADGMSEVLGRPVVVENRAGAGTAIGARAVAQAKPDGYVLFIGGSPSHVITPALMKDANYDGIKDFTPDRHRRGCSERAGRAAGPPLQEREGAGRGCQERRRQDDICIDRGRQHPAVSRRSFAAARRREARRSALPGAASLRSVDLLGGRVDMAFLKLRPCCRRFRPGNLRALAVAAATRIKSLPDTPSMPEAGYPSVTMSTWYGISAPAGTPREIVSRLHAAIAQTLGTPKTRQKIESQGAEIFLKSPEEYAAYLQADAKLMLELIKAANMTAQ